MSDPSLPSLTGLNQAQHDNSVNIHYTMAFVWPTLGTSNTTVPWEYDTADKKRNGPAYYFACMLDFIQRNRGTRVKFSVYMHGALWHDLSLDILRHEIIAASKETACVHFCAKDMPPMFPKMQRLIPVIDAKEKNTVVICVDIHDGIERQNRQVTAFLKLMQTPGKEGVATFYPCEDFYSSPGLNGVFGTDPTVVKTPVLKARSDAVVKGSKSALNILLEETQRWIADAGLIMTTDEGRTIIREAYNGMTFGEHVDVMGKRMEFGNKFAWDGTWGVEEMALTQYLFAFQPLSNKSKSMVTYDYTNKEDEATMLRMYNAVKDVFDPYVHTLGERKDDPPREGTNTLDDQANVVYTYESPRNGWLFADQEERGDARETFAGISDQDSIIELSWEALRSPSKSQRSVLHIMRATEARVGYI